MTTIQDVARAAQVSTATVSRVLNGKRNVAPELASRVQEAIEASGYRPNVLAKGLRTRATTVLGLVIPDIENPFHTAIARGAEDAAQSRRYSLLLCNSDEDLDKELHYLDVLLDQLVAGLIIEPVSEESSAVARFVERGVPVVIVDRTVRNLALDTVTVNNVLGAETATESLFAAGFERLAMVGGPVDRTTAVGRREGFVLAHQKRNREPSPELIVSGGYRIDGGYKATRQLLELSPRPDALFVANNLMATGALQALSELGLRVPRDLGFATFDEPPWGIGSHELNCVVHQPGRAMGKLATEILLDRIDGDDGPIRNLMLDASISGAQRRVAPVGVDGRAGQARTERRVSDPWA